MDSRPRLVFATMWNTVSKDDFLTVEQILLVFGSDEDDIAEDVCSSDQDKMPLKKEYSGTLRSGWKPMLAVIGLASRDADDVIATLDFKMLTTQLRKGINIDKLSQSSKSGIPPCPAIMKSINNDDNDSSVVSKPMLA